MMIITLKVEIPLMIITLKERIPMMIITLLARGFGHTISKRLGKKRVLNTAFYTRIRSIGEAF